MLTANLAQGCFNCAANKTEYSAELMAAQMQNYMSNGNMKDSLSFIKKHLYGLLVFECFITYILSYFR